MTVDEASALRVERDGQTFDFCGDHCRQRFLSSPATAKHEGKGIDFPQRVRILDVCNPERASRVLTIDMAVNLALPCRISVFEDGGRVKIGMIKPFFLLSVFPGWEKMKGGRGRGRAGHDPYYRRCPLDGFDDGLRRATALGLSTTAERSTIAVCCSSIAALGRMPCRQSRMPSAVRPVTC